MRIASSRRGARTALVAAFALATALAGDGAAAVSPQTSSVDVAIGPSGISASAPAGRTCGSVTFRVRTADREGRRLQVLRPKEGVRPDRLRRDLVEAVSREPATRAAGIRAVREDADALGGALVTRAVPVEFTETLATGRIYLMDFGAFLRNPRGRVAFTPLDLRGPCRDEFYHPAADGRVLTVETSAGPRFRTRDVDDASGTFLVRNTSPELHEMEIQPVRRGTTDEDLARYFDATAHGRKARTPFTGAPSGLGAISPSRTVTVHPLLLPRGTYALLCYLPDEENGLPHTALGMHKVVELQ